MYIYGKDNIEERYRHAEKNQYAIPAFNFSDIWDLKGIIEAADELKSPVIIMTEPAVYNLIDLETCAQIGKTMAASAIAPVFLHLDHSENVTDCSHAIELGYSSVMMDASKYPVEENIKKVKEVVMKAHTKSVFVEAEIGKIFDAANLEDIHNSEDYLVNTDEAVKLAAETGVDSLAVAIGNAHGFYRKNPEINFERLQEVHKALKIPLVLHGGTGIPANDVRKAITNGIRKVNVGTDVYCTLTNGLKAQLNKYGENQYLFDILLPVINSVKEVVRKWIKVCMSDGKA